MTTIDPELLMAYADGELSPLDAKRVERAIAADPALAREVERHRVLRARIADSFAPIAEEAVPGRLADLLETNVVALPRRPAPRGASRWREVAVLAACVILGLLIGGIIPRGGPVAARDGGLYAAGSLADALDVQPGGASGTVRVAVSFRDAKGAYCRVFSSAAADGIACRDANGWALRRTQQGLAAKAGTAYVQAASADPELLAAAQEMMAGEPLDAVAEQAARRNGWR